MRLAKDDHTARPWRIHEFTRDFRLEDVWALPTTGERDDFARLVELVMSFDPAQSSSFAVRSLSALRWKLGEVFDWDEPDAGLGSRVQSLRARLSAELRDGPSGPESPELPLSPVYLLGDEFAAEAANRTVHMVLHLGWVPDANGGFRGEMAFYVKPNGLFGNLYMAGIMPFRYLLVYPPLLREIGRAWRTAEEPAPRDVSPVGEKN
jgi:Protein of unknown function (DUF2867)